MSIINTTKRYIPGGFRLIPNEWTAVIGRNIPSILLNNVYDLNKIGAESMYGAVYQIVSTDFIIKIMARRDRSDVIIFDNEVNVGSMRGIGHVGPRIYAYKKTPTQMIYIMNNVITQSNLASGHKLLTLSDYCKKILMACPPRGHPIYKELSKTLVKFYTFTKGWHGDLHDQNILVILDSSNNVISTKIIDYGAHQKFTRSVPTCLRDIFTQINRDFTRSRNQNITYSYPTFFGKLKQPAAGGQSYRMNQEALSLSLNPSFIRRLMNTNNAERNRLAQEAAERNRLAREAAARQAEMNQLVREAEKNYIKDVQNASQEINNISQNLHRKISTEKNNLKRRGVNNEKIQKFSTNLNKLLNKELNKYEKKLTSYSIRKVFKTGKKNDRDKNKLEIQKLINNKRKSKNEYIKKMKNELRSNLPTPMNINQ